MNGFEILRAASDAIFVNRQNYANPVRSFARIATLWSTLGFRRDGKCLSGEDVALAMILLKVARQSFTSKDDNWIDIAGYAACGAEYCGEIEREADATAEVVDDSDSG